MKTKHHRWTAASPSGTKQERNFGRNWPT